MRLSNGLYWDARVIVKDLMGSLGLKQSLLDLGLPSITKLVKFDHLIAQGDTHGNWPLTNRNEPAVSSMQTQMLTYGHEHYMVSVITSSLFIIHFALQISHSLSAQNGALHYAG